MIADDSPQARDATLIAHLRKVNERLAIENRYLRGQVIPGDGFETIVGTSEAMRRVLDQVRRVLPTSTTVLLEGPTGSGKELVARAIHNEGPRQGELFVAVNCGGMPEDLLASALFGHRRGAFTGAVGDQKGFFELASGGTLFLDEVGETSATMQVHLRHRGQQSRSRNRGARGDVPVGPLASAAGLSDPSAVARGAARRRTRPRGASAAPVDHEAREVRGRIHVGRDRRAGTARLRGQRA